MRQIARIGLTIAALSLAAAPTHAQDFDEAGYRTTRYRAPVAELPEPAMRMAAADVLALDPERDALFLDVMPVEGGVRDEASGAWKLSTGHETIPGAQWHPETGRSPVDTVLWDALVRAIAAARRTDPALPVVVFCREDCWMSWNAARRLATQGIPRVYWFAEGTDGWHAAGRPLTAAIPVSVPRHSCKERK